MVKKRNQAIDCIKGIAIILVLIGHCIQYGSGNYYYINNEFFDNIVFRVIYSFHMPLFAIISGYLLHYSLNNHTAKDLIVTKIKTLIVPVVIWCTLFLIIQFVVGFKTVFISELIINYLNNIMSMFWFITSIFICSIIVIINNKHFNDSLLLYLIILIIFFFLPDVKISKFIPFLFLPFLLGYLYNKKEIHTKYNIKKHYAIIFTITAITFVLMLLCFDNNCYIYTTGFSILKNGSISYIQIYYNFYRWVIGIAGSIVIIILFNYMLQMKNKVLSYIGMKSIGIYIISTLLFKIMLKLTAGFKHLLLMNLCETVGVLIISLLLCILIEKNTICNKLLLGGR